MGWVLNAQTKALGFEVIVDQEARQLIMQE